MPAQEREPDNSLRARRCDLGCESWPNTAEYKVCPLCGEPTRVFSSMKPLGATEALSKKRHAEFEQWLEDHDRL